MSTQQHFYLRPLAVAVLAATGASTAAAQEGQIEEVVVTARLKSIANDVAIERMEQAVAADFLDVGAISRVGDSTVALALRRVPGLTLVDDKFVYVRGLGERYASTLLNGAPVPSPDLTRNVVPLDIFPTAVLHSLSVQKAYSPDMPAGFGGGAIDIRTRAVPDQPILSVQLGSGYNTDSTGDDGFYYPGGKDDQWGTDDGTRSLPVELREAIQLYQGKVDAVSLTNALRRDGNQYTLADGEALNRELATALNRDVDLRQKSLDPDMDGEVVAGSNWIINDMWEAGGVVVGSYSREWRNRERANRSVADPESLFFKTRRTVETVDIVGTANAGLRYGDDHAVEGLAMFIRNTEDEASISSGHTQNFALADGNRLSNYDLRFEERELEVYQTKGSHALGEQTLDLIGRFIPRSWFEPLRDLNGSWYYSESYATTDIPNELRISAQERIDPDSGEVLFSRVRTSGTAADYRFSELDDNVDAWGSQIRLPLAAGDWEIELVGGYDYSRKYREYYQIRYGLGTTSTSEFLLAGDFSDVFSDANITDPANLFVLSIGGIGTESYLAAQTTEAWHGVLDATWSDTWRIAAGLRWEQFDQVSLPIDQLEFDPRIGQVQLTPDQIGDSVFLEDDYYPSLAFTYMRPGFWAEDFQLRLSWSETVVRPDLREISRSTFIDPLTEARVSGNPGLVPSELQNLDLRAEWFFSGGDNFTVSLFYKDISNPIETIQAAGSDDNISLTYVNAERAEIYGVEFEWLKGLGFLSGYIGGWVDSFFFSGNATLSESEIEIDTSVLSLTNDKRPLSGHSDAVLNFQLGFDSPDGMHSASLVYNVFAERVFFGGRNGADDTYEQPFQSVDMVYSFYPSENLTLKLAMKNLLDDEQEFEQSSVTVLEQTVGRSVSLDFSWKL